MVAIERRHYEIVELLVSKGADLKVKISENSNGSIHVAIASRRLEVVKLLISKDKTLLKSTNEHGSTPLLLAAYNGELEMMDWLLECGSSFDEKDFLGRNALLLAATMKNQKIEVFSYLLEHGLSIASTDSSGYTVMHQLAYANALQAIRFFKNKGADLKSEGKDGKTPLDLVDKNNTQTVYLLVTLELFEHVKGGTIHKVVEMLKEYPQHMEARDDRGCTPLLSAVSYGKIELLKKLISLNADKNARNIEGSGIKSSGNTALLWAAYEGHLDIIKYLLENDLSYIDETNDAGMNVLLCASNNGHISIVEWLIKNTRVDT